MGDVRSDDAGDARYVTVRRAIVVGELAPAREDIAFAGEETHQLLARRDPIGQCERRVAVVGNEPVGAALERICSAHLDGFMTLTSGRERNLPLAIQREGAIVTQARQHHAIVHIAQRLNAQTFRQGRSDFGLAFHRPRPFDAPCRLSCSAGFEALGN